MRRRFDSSKLLAVGLICKLPLGLGSDKVVISLGLDPEDSNLVKLVIARTQLASLTNTECAGTSEESDLCRFQREMHLAFPNSAIPVVVGAGATLALVLNIRKPDIPCVAGIKTDAL